MRSVLGASGTLALELPPGFSAEPGQRAVHGGRRRRDRRVRFKVTPPRAAARGTLRAVATVNGPALRPRAAPHRRSRTSPSRPGSRRRRCSSRAPTWPTPGGASATSPARATRFPQALRQAGYEVTPLSVADLRDGSAHALRRGGVRDPRLQRRAAAAVAPRQADGATWLGRDGAGAVRDQQLHLQGATGSRAPSPSPSGRDGSPTRPRRWRPSADPVLAAPEPHRTGRLGGLGPGARALLRRVMGPALRDAAVDARPRRAAAEGVGAGGAVRARAPSSTPGCRSSGSSPRGSRARSGSSPTWWMRVAEPEGRRSAGADSTPWSSARSRWRSPLSGCWSGSSGERARLGGAGRSRWWASSPSAAGGAGACTPPSPTCARGRTSAGGPSVCRSSPPRPARSPSSRYRGRRTRTGWASCSSTSGCRSPWCCSRRSSCRSTTGSGSTPPTSTSSSASTGAPGSSPPCSS